MGKVKNRVLRYCQGIVEVPCEIKYDYNHERGNRGGRAYITIFLSATTIYGKFYEKFKRLDNFEFELVLNKKTRRVSKSFARQRARDVGKGLINKLRFEGVIPLSRKK